MMKIPRGIRVIYEGLEENFKNLKIRVDNKIKSNLPDGWHYTSRIKGLQSFALKIESGRCKSIDEFEDFFAGTIVVENLTKLEKAEEMIKSNFQIEYKRPKNPNLTKKNSEAFVFDDLRLYCKWLKQPGEKQTNLGNLLFEVQIKTFLQHAWAIATHDLVYKSDEKSWSKERIAYQIKAMLEHAEISIFEANNLAQCCHINKSNKDTNSIIKIIELVKKYWQPYDLPHDLKTLANNIFKTICLIKIDIEKLDKVLEKENKERLGIKAKNLSPFGVITQALINQIPQEFNKIPPWKKIYVHKELDFTNAPELRKLKSFITLK